MKYEELLSIIPDEKSAINFLVSKSIIKAPNCANEHPMRLSAKEQNRYIWVCNPCMYKRLPGSQIALRVNNWIEGSKLPIATIVKFVYAWSHIWSTDEYCAEQLNMSHVAAIEWRSFMRDVCSWRICNEDMVPIGGAGNEDI